ncbi:MAG: Ig-like domain-containing protein [Myxococcota bacterium]
MLSLMYRALLVLVLSGVGCTSVEVSDDGGPDGPPVEPTRQLTVLGEDSLPLLYEEAADFAVRYTEQDGTPIAGEPVEFAFIGQANDSTLSSLEAITDTEGVARGTVAAGNTSSVFRVRARAERAAAAFFDVSVSNTGFGRIDVGLELSERRVAASLQALLFEEGSCSERDTLLDREPSRLNRLSVDARETLFRGLPAEADYAIVARAVGPDDDVVAVGCVDKVRVLADETTSVVVTLEDVALRPDGVYVVTGEFDVAPATMLLADAVTAAGSTSLGASDAATLLDAVESYLDDMGLNGELSTVRALRSSAGYDAALDVILTGARTGPSVALADLSTLVETWLSRFEVVGRIEIPESPSEASFTATRFFARSDEPDVAALPLELFVLGVNSAGGLALEAGANDRLLIDELAIDAPLGKVAEALFVALADERMLAEPFELLLPGLGCGELETFAASEALDNSCDATCIRSACHEFAEGLLERIGADLPVVDQRRAALRVGGSAELVDESGDLRPNAIAAAELSGGWWSADGTESDGVTARLMGMRSLQ